MVTRSAKCSEEWEIHMELEQSTLETFLVINKCMELCYHCADKCEAWGTMVLCVEQCRACHLACNKVIKEIRLNRFDQLKPCILACERTARECRKWKDELETCSLCAEACWAGASAMRDLWIQWRNEVTRSSGISFTLQSTVTSSSNF